MKLGDGAGKNGNNAVERLRADLVAELRLMTPADLQAYWKQVPWQKPDLVELAKKESSQGNPTPLATALRRLRPEILARASEQLDPFGWLLDAAVDVRGWSDYCHKNDAPWMTRIWLATASQLRAERRLIHKAHGWAEKWEKLRRNPKTLCCADELFLAQLRHANKDRQLELLTMPGLDERLAKARHERDEAFLKRFRRAKQGAGKRADVALAEKYTVQHWLEMPRGLPGLCFFSDTALHSLLVILRLTTPKAESHVTTLLRGRIDLIQSGAKRHLIEHVLSLDHKLSFTGSMMTTPCIFERTIAWGERHLWPQYT